MKKGILLLLLLFAAIGSTFAFEEDKTYTILNSQSTNRYMQDNGTGKVALDSKNNNSYWKFVPTANADCYYIQNASTGEYIQGYSGSEQEVATGSVGVEYYVKADASGTYAGKYRMSCTANSPHDFSNNTLGLNWKNNDIVQSFASVAGGNPRSAWTVTEEAMPGPIKGLTSPYAGVVPAVGEEFYLYNLKTGKWIGDNHVNTNGTWTSHAELGPRGRDIELKVGDADGRFILNPKLGNNHSINGSNLYMDTNDGVTNWIFTSIDVEGVTNCYTLTTPGGKAIGADASGWATSDPGAIAENGNVWQLVSREQRLAAMQEGDDCSWLVLGGTFPVADSHKGEAAYKKWQGDFGDNDITGDGIYHCNRVWELWGITDRDVYQDIILPNGKYKFKAQAIYVSTGAADMNEERYNEYISDPTGNTKGVVYANDVTTPMINVYSLVESERKDNRNSKEIKSDVFAYNGNNEFSANMFEGKGWTDEVEVEVTNGKLRVGARVSGATNAWMLLDNFTLTYNGEIVIEDLTPYIEALERTIENAKEYNGETTSALRVALEEALANAQNVSCTDADAMTTVTTALEAALNRAKTVDVSILRATVQLAEEEGVDVSAQKDYLVNGTTDEVADQLFSVRTLRKLKAQRQPDIYTGASSPAAETEYYLYNVGTGMWLTNASDWNTHAAVGMYGIVITLTARDGKWIMNTPFGKLNWNAYVDTTDDHTWTFNPVDGQTNVFTINSEGNRVDVGRLLGYDANGPTDKGNYHFWSTVAKDRENVNNPNNQWKLVTKEERDNLVAAASKDNPVDASYLIKNPALSRQPGLDAWDLSVTPDGKPKDLKASGDDGKFDRNDDYAVEFWDFQTFNISQTISNLTPGLYEVGVQAFYRHSNRDGQRDKLNACSSLDELESKAYLYANDEKALLPNIATVLDKLPGIATISSDKGCFLDEPKNAIQAFETGFYKQTVVVAVGNDGELKIGVTQPEDAGDDFKESWVMVDNFRLTYLGPTTEEVEVTSAGYATYCSENALDFTNTDIKAYVGTREGDKLTFTQIVKVPANTGLLLVAEGGKKESVPVIAEAEAVSGNCLVGVNEQTTINSSDYILNVKNGGAGFYKAGSYTTLAAHRAYIPASVGGEIKNFIIDLEDDATAVSEVESSGLKGEGPVFNLSGQRLNKAAKGVNIINGKKILK